MDLDSLIMLAAAILYPTCTNMEFAVNKAKRLWKVVCDHRADEPGEPEGREHGG
jgi:hypothetical protein